MTDDRAQDRAQDTDQDHPPSREGLGDDEAWEWADGSWRVRRILPFEQGNVGGSPARVEDA